MKNKLSDSKAVRVGAVLFGLLFASMGVMVLLAVLGYLPSRQALTLPAKIVMTLTTGVFIFAGVGILLFGIGATRVAAKTAAFALLFFLLTFNWIAFGPGERSFSRKIGSNFTATSATKISETEGRIVFGVFAGLMDLLLIYGFVRAKKSKS